MESNKVKIENNVIEIHNNWVGKQTIIFNGQVVSKKFAFSGTDHYFTVFKDGKDVPYILTTKTSSKEQILRSDQMLIDLRCDGFLLEENLLIKFGVAQEKEKNKYKAEGLKFLSDYEIPNAISALHRGLEYDNKDPHIYFYLACCFSIAEQKEAGLRNLKMAIVHHLNDKELILNHEMLAYLRTQEEFNDIIGIDAKNDE